MANRNHALDAAIERSALQEFLTFGYEKASLRRIAAEAGATVGAIYTRYPTKDALFCTLVQPLLDRIEEAFTSLRTAYRREADQSPEADFADSMRLESQAILHFLFDDHDRAVLLLCRSGGSSLEGFFQQVVERKIQETAAFFVQIGIPHPDQRLLRLLLTGQFHMYFQILQEDFTLDEAREIMNAAALYHTGGWLTLFHHMDPRIKNEGGLS